MTQTTTAPHIIHPRPRLASLPPRTLEIMRLYSQGVTYKLIGQQLGMTRSAIDFTIRQAMKKTGALNSAHLIAMAIRDGVI